MHLGGLANYVADITTAEDLQLLYQNSKKLGQPVYVIGTGSNLIAHDEGFPGVIIHNKIKGIEILEEDENGLMVAAGAGEIWDTLVQQMVERNVTGIEAMSGIPGTAGAAPVQNIGAYGQELSTSLVSLDAYDTQTDSFVTLHWDDCGFSYRNSIFRSTAVGRYIITRITLSLKKMRPVPPFYGAVEKYLQEREIGTMSVTPQVIRDAVLSIRKDKLPNPELLPNSGSFFKNAIVEKWKADDLVRTYGDMPLYPVDETHTKIPSGWLIENVNLKGEVLHGIKVHDKNAVVLINQSAKGYSDLAAAKDEIVTAVRDKFQIILEQEPLELTPGK
jgi:UDP-N-acetylmuramate dehydrogenase